MNGWPNPDAPGVPENPKSDGWHWLQHKDASFCVPVEWRHPGGWVANSIPMLENEVQKFVIECCKYFGPCLPPVMKENDQ